MNDAVASLEDIITPDTPMWPVLHEDACHGLVGEVVDGVLPHTEADPAALALTLLAEFGCAAGRDRYAIAGAAQHPAKLFGVVVGRTSSARKGTAAAEIARLFEVADPKFAHFHVAGGLSSGEGLVFAVRDGADEEDSGVLDKRLFVFEPEFSRVLAVSRREGSNLSQIIREAWDGKRMATMTRRDPMKATGHHINVIAHITVEELRRSLTSTDIANGFGNRFLFALAKRSKKLPSGGSLEEGVIKDLGKKLGRALEQAREKGQVMRRSPGAETLWAEIYNAIDDNIDGILGSIVARAPAQMLRLSVAYALLDMSTTIEVVHVKAAQAMWDFCEASARWIYGDVIGDEVADRLLEGLQHAGDGGLDATQQFALFGRNVTKERLDAARLVLETQGLITTTTEESGGRPRHVSHIVTKENELTNKAPGPTLTSVNSFSSDSAEWTFGYRAAPCVVCGERCIATDPEGRVRHPACVPPADRSHAEAQR